MTWCIPGEFIKRRMIIDNYHQLVMQAGIMKKMVVITNDTILHKGKKTQKKVTKAFKEETDIFTDQYC